MAAAAPPSLASVDLGPSGMFTPGLVALVPRSASCGDLLTFGCYHSRTIVSSQALVGSSQWWVPGIVQES